MTVRVVVAAVLALSICGVALPLVEDATATRADAAGAREAAEVADAVATLAESDAAVGPGARETVEVSLPDGPGRGVAAVAVGGVPGTDRRGVVAYRVEGGDWRVGAHLPIGVRTAEGGPLIVRDGAHITLRLDRQDGTRIARASARNL